MIILLYLFSNSGSEQGSAFILTMIGFMALSHKFPPYESKNKNALYLESIYVLLITTVLSFYI